MLVMITALGRSQKLIKFNYNSENISDKNCLSCLHWNCVAPTHFCTFTFLYFQLDTLFFRLHTISAIFFPLHVSGLTGPSSGGLNCTCSLWCSPPDNGIFIVILLKYWLECHLSYRLLGIVKNKLYWDARSTNYYHFCTMIYFLEK